MWVRLDIAMVECTSIMHVHVVIIFEMGNKGWNVTCDRTFRTSIWTIVRTEPAVLFMLELAVVRKNIMTAKILISARKLQRLGYLLQSQTTNITELKATSWTAIVHPNFAV